MTKQTKEPIPFANVVDAKWVSIQMGGATSDFDGNYLIKPVPREGSTVKAAYVGYNDYVMQRRDHFRRQDHVPGCRAPEDNH
ncbi:MAG: carboxypeptidase-like regulatory domain-containing protein [Sphingobacterium sp.]|nr:carboxypeptidase-like regulatory domain-containing protein [Sphingobacterium sp.]